MYTPFQLNKTANATTAEGLSERRATVYLRLALFPTEITDAPPGEHHVGCLLDDVPAPDDDCKEEEVNLVVK